MAKLQIRIDGDPILRKKSRKVETIDEDLRRLVDDMYETMYEAQGVGLAAVQIGKLKQLIVLDDYEGTKMVLINPERVAEEGSSEALEGCLSVPGMAGQVTRPNYVKVKAMDEEMNEVIYEGTELLARAFCHEIDHLDGKMYTDLVEGELHRTSYEED